MPRRRLFRSTYRVAVSAAYRIGHSAPFFTTFLLMRSLPRRVSTSEATTASGGLEIRPTATPHPMNALGSDEPVGRISNPSEGGSDICPNLRRRHGPMP
jgi:hypothetical protein